MLLLTRLNGHPMAINGDLIKSIESSPDTMITLITGEKIVVLETLRQVVDAAHAWRLQLLRESLAEVTHTSAQALQNAASDAALSAGIAAKAVPDPAAHRQPK